MNVFELRYVLIKYSMRGLAENGKIPPLFNYLYALVISTFYLLFLILFLSVYIIPRYSQFAVIVLNQFSMEEAENNLPFSKTQRINLAFLLTFLLLIIILIIAILYNLKGLSVNQKFKRHNVFTLYLTVFWGFLHFVIVLIFFAALKNNWYLVLNIFRIFLIITSHFLKPIFTIVEVRQNLPELFVDNSMSISYPKNFFVSHMNISPRREPFMPLIPFKQNAR